MGVGGHDRNLTEGKESVSISLQSVWEGGGGEGGAERTDQGAENNYGNNSIKPLYKACHEAALF